MTRQADHARQAERLLVAGGAAVLAGSTALARRATLHPREEAAFRTVNRLPSALLPPVYVVMQSGSLAAVFVVSAVVGRVVGRKTAVTTFAAGFSAWLGAKGVKRYVQRGRPSAHLDRVVVRGPAERGLGFPSGHSAVACAMAVAVSGRVPAPWTAVAWMVAPVVGVARIYVGAHLPLDVLGGVALGSALGGTARLVADRISSPEGG